MAASNQIILSAIAGLVVKNMPEAACGWIDRLRVEYNTQDHQFWSQLNDIETEVKQIWGTV